MKTNLRGKIISAMLGLFVAIFSSVAFGDGAVFAGGYAGGGEVNVSPSTSCGGTNCYSKDYGAVWFFYYLQHKEGGTWYPSTDPRFNGENKITHNFVIPKVRATGLDQKTVTKKCGNADGFYFLGWAGHNSDAKSSGMQLGAVNLGMIKAYGGYVKKVGPSSEIEGTGKLAFGDVALSGTVEMDNDRALVKSSEKNPKFPKVGASVRGWREACDKFYDAQRNGLNGEYADAKWECDADTVDNKAKGLVWFCAFDPDNPTKDGSFASRSKVEKSEWSEEDSGGQHDPTKPVAIGEDIKLKGSEPTQTAKVKFTHRILVAPTDDYDLFKKANPATDYKIIQTIDGGSKETKKTGTLTVRKLDEKTENTKYHKDIADEATVTVSRNTSVKVCQTIEYNHKKFKVTDDGKLDGDPSGKNDSEACVTIRYDGDQDIPGAFYSQSSVSGVTTNRDENRTTPVKTIEMSADETSGSVTFNHIIGSELAGDVYNKAVGAGANTTWTVSQTSYNPNGNVRTGTTYMGSLSNVSGTNVYTQNVISIPVNVSVSQNSYATVCQKITYTTKNFVIKNNSFNPQGNSGSSSICIRLHRPSTSYYCRNVLSGYLSNASYGNTVAETKVKMDNSNGTTGWKDTILAKPSDEIQFRHTLCFGAQAVTSSGRYTNGTYRRKSSQLSEEEFPSNYFYLSGYRDNDYLFNRRDDGVVYIPRATAKPTTFYYSPNGGVTSFKPEETYQDYGIRFYSPKNASTGGATSYSTNPYNCEINTFLSGWTLGFKANAYRIPGFDYGACNSAANVAVNNSDVGSEIRQNLHYNDVEAWIQWKHDKSNAICQGCESYYDGASGSEPRAEPIYRQYLGSAREAANSGGWIWGYLEQDCKQTRCSNSGYQYKDSTTGCTNNPETSNCSYRSWSTANVGCSLGYHRGENTYPYSTTGNGHYYSDWYCHTNNQNVRDTKYNNPSNRTPGSSVTYGAGITDYEQQKTATVKIPYNFKTETTAKITGGDVVGGVVYAGEPADSTFVVKVKSRINPDVDPNRNYLTITPSNTVVQFISFTVNSHVSESTANDAVKGGISYGNENIVSYFSRKFGRIDNIHTLYSRYGAVNGEGNLNGPVFAQGSSMTYSESIPDVEVGSKYCVAVGISHADSHGIPDLDLRAGQGVYGYSMSGANPSWRISNASCRTIAKKPNFQAWGGVYTPGGILTSQSPKSRINNTFGSWVDTLAIANKSIIANKRYSGFSSGAGLGYIGSGGGANGTGLNYCNLTKMTIANNLCSSKITGNAGGITTFNPLEQLLSRYTPETKEPRSGYNLGSQPTQTLNGGGLYTYTKENANMGPLTVTSGTRVIEIDKNLTIDHNICAGTGSCQSTGYNNLTLRDRNNHTYYSNSEGIGNIPQVIIIVRGNVKISSEVTQIDAWLFVDGTIDTCYGGFSDSNSCNKTLIFNGPVFANKLALNRTAGAYPGPNAFGSAYYDQDLASSNRGVDYYSGNYTDPKYGSITPAEIFNLRPDTYFWAYNQANRLSQAQVVYMRELAPRY